MREKDSITACLVIHNEDGVLKRCLDSVSKVTKTILVVHDGPCSDTSLLICKQFGCVVFIRPFIGEAEPHRAWLLKKVTSMYCLQIDADEFLTDSFIRSVPKLLTKKADGYTCIWPYWNGTEYKTTQWPRKLLLYKVDSISYLAAPHETVRVKGITTDTPYVLEHKPTYDNLSWSTFQTKWMKWAKLHAQFYLKSSNQIERFQDDEDTLLPHYSSWMRYAPFSAPILGLYHFLGSLKSGAIWEGFIGIKSSFFMGLYYTVVCFYVGKLKYAKIS